MNSEHVQSRPGRIIEDAGHALGQYVTRGPLLPPEAGNIRGLEGVRARLDPSPCAEHQETAGWVAIEQAFAVAANPQLRRRYPLRPLFQAAEDSFTLALDRYDANFDPLTHSLQVELAMASLAIYTSWAAKEELSGAAVAEFHEDVAEVGRGLLDLNERLQQAPDDEGQRYANGLAAELIVMLAFNRRHTKEDGATSLAIPSTMRQNRSARRGTIGSTYDASKLRSNWDVSVVGNKDVAWNISDKLQVKNILAAPVKDHSGRPKQMYTEDITMVGVKEHILYGLSGIDTWGALHILTEPSTGSSSAQKKNAAAMSRALFTHLEVDRRRRQAVGQA